ncbi:MAG: phage head-tail joining protein [Gemmobacter sp.]|uniref:phage head-tail joining protein n=1 Tax=Gemmobacter sp. TaxID=1898957 RepID=UPI00391A670A
MAFTVEQRTALAEAIARGALEVQMGQERVKYRSLAEMRQILALMDAELSGTAATRHQFGVIYPTTGRGL